MNIYIVDFNFPLIFCFARIGSITFDAAVIADDVREPKAVNEIAAALIKLVNVEFTINSTKGLSSNLTVNNKTGRIFHFYWYVITY